MDIINQVRCWQWSTEYISGIKITPVREQVVGQSVHVEDYMPAVEYLQQQACVYFWRQIVLAAQRTTSSVIRIHYLYESVSCCSCMSPRQYALKQKLTTWESGPPNTPTLYQQLVSKPSQQAKLINSHHDSRLPNNWLILLFSQVVQLALRLMATLRTYLKNIQDQIGHQSSVTREIAPSTDHNRCCRHCETWPSPRTLLGIPPCLPDPSGSQLF